MRIQHNIMAMSAYRNYTNNTSAVSKNLERLSSGYKINRAGDDAAGLAISEKMRAQITGLNAAQKNVKDGISLVKTAEGAMQEIQDMLNRMDYLATQSANGTYDNETDRAALQKEVEQLKSEINRIADSANFNGIKLLDGSLDATGAPSSVTGSDRIISEVWDGTGSPAELTGTKTFLDGAEATKATKTVFEMDFSDLKAVGDAGGAGGTNTPSKIEGTPGTVSVGGNDCDFAAGTGLKTAIDAKVAGGATITDGADVKVEYSGGAWKVSVGGTDLGTITAVDNGTGKLTLSDDGGNELVTITGANNESETDYQGALGTATSTGLTFTNAVAGGGGGGAAGGVTTTVKLNGVDIVTDIALTDGDDAEAIAKAVIKELNGGTDATKVENVDLFGDGSANYTVELDGTKLKFTLEDDPTADNIKGNFDWDVSITGGQYEGNHTAGTNVLTPGSVDAAGARANTVFEIKDTDLTDGTTITIDGKTVTLSVGPESKVQAGAGVVKLTTTEAADLDLALGKISQAFGGETTNFEISVNNGGNNDAKTGLAIYRKADSTKTYTTKEDLASVFSMKVAAGGGSGTALTLQIGDTSDSYNQLKVSVGDMHTSAMGIANLNIGNQADAAAAIQTIRNAINYVSGVRGDLGATQNRLEHTANNLSVMAENIQDAESTIRDTDIAEEMMSYTKNNILVQSAQAMLAQANQVPQGVLQLLG